MYVDGVLDSSMVVVILPTIINDLPAFLQSIIVSTNVHFDWNDESLNDTSFEVEGILLNPLTFSSTNYTGENGLPCFELNITDTSSSFLTTSYVQDDVITVGSYVGTVVKWTMISSASGKLIIQLPRLASNLTGMVINSISVRTVSSYTPPVIDSHSGIMIETNSIATATKTDTTSQTFTTYRIF